MQGKAIEKLAGLTELLKCNRRITSRGHCVPVIVEINHATA
jgi:hypothetical protein